MVKFLYFIFLGIFAASAQENAIRTVPSSLRECYGNKYLLERDNRLPHTLNTFLAILRKIENSEGLNMDLRSLSVALLHRFRQDGIFHDPTIKEVGGGITPYAPSGFQFVRHAQTLRFVPGNAMLFPNNSITDVERCTLHFMVSSSIEPFERGDEGTVCRYASDAYRRIRSVEDTTSKDIEDVETLSPEQIEIITAHKSNSGDIDPNSFYPELPPNHPDIARVSKYPDRSRCPVENGVIKTPWGAVSGGPLLAGIAAAMEPQTIRLKDILQDNSEKDVYPSDAVLSNKWLATLAGDLAEAALRQGPRGDQIKIGVKGNWNSTTVPRWYFLQSNEKLEFTTAEIRGDLDGLILANEIGDLYKKIPTLKLSQILDMYYSGRGLFNSTIRACNRRLLLTSVAPNDTMSAQTFSASVVLKSLARATLNVPVMEKFAVDAAKELTIYIPSSMNEDLSCQDTDKLYDNHQLFVDLTIILDTNWPFVTVQPVLAHLLENMEINLYNSNFTLINAHDGTAMINNTNSILDFYKFNSSHYENATRGFDLPKSIEMLRIMQAKKLNRERDERIGGTNSDVVLIIPYTSTLTSSDNEYCKEQLKAMREQVPDATVLFLTYGSKDRWSDLVYNTGTDLFSISIANTNEGLPPLDPLISRIKQVPKRLFNSQCGSDYVAIGSSDSYTDYIEPFGINFYRLHPNYFFTADTTSSPAVIVEAPSGTTLMVCASRDLLHINATDAKAAASCASVTNDKHRIPVSCADAYFIHQCPPLYISVATNSSNNMYQCTDPRNCRFANLIKYTISYENLLCTSGTSTLVSSPVILGLLIAYFYL